MAANKAFKGKSNKNRFSKTFSRADAETSLLLQIVTDYKASKSTAGLDWEMVKTDMKILLRDFRPIIPDRVQMQT